MTDEIAKPPLPFSAADEAESYLAKVAAIPDAPADPIMYLLWCYTPETMQCGNFADHVIEARFRQTRQIWIESVGQEYIEYWAQKMDDGLRELFANPTPDILDLVETARQKWASIPKDELEKFEKAPRMSLVDVFWKLAGEAILQDWCDALVLKMGEATKTAHLGNLIDTLDTLAGMRAYLKSIGKTEYVPIVDNAIAMGKHYEDAVTELALTLRKRLLARMPYKEYLCTPDWIERRNRKLKQANGRCELCNSASGLQVHHKTYLRRGDEWDSDLIVLCDRCHAKHHDKFPKEPEAA